MKRWELLAKVAFVSALLLGLFHGSAFALSTVTIVATTNNAAGDISVQGTVPLNVTFTATPDAGTIETYVWNFGDGLVSNQATPSHIFTVAGTYTVEVNVTANGGSEQATDTILVIVKGPGEGPVTPGINLRWGVLTSSFKLLHNATKKDSFQLDSVLSTVDLPSSLNTLPIQFFINDTLLFSNFLDADGVFVQRANATRPRVLTVVDVERQKLVVKLSNADLAAAFAAGGIGDANSPKGSPPLPVTLKVVIGAQTYQFTLAYEYLSTQGRAGKGTFNLRGIRGAVVDGFLVVQNALAQETQITKRHFFQIKGLIAKPNGVPFEAPDFDTNFTQVEVGSYIQNIPPDRFRDRQTRITMFQKDRLRGGVRDWSINNRQFTFTLRTWDIDSQGENGTTLPVRGENVTRFDLIFRVDLEPIFGTDDFDFQGATATEISRRGRQDGAWETGRRR